MAEWFVLLPILVIILYFWKKKGNKIDDKIKNKSYTIDDRYNIAKKEREKEIDRLLDKMGENGINDLSPKDRKRLEELSKK